MRTTEDDGNCDEALDMDGALTRKHMTEEHKRLRYRITVAYDGTAYAGWQMQPKNPTVQETLQVALRSLCGEEVKVHGSGRTDAGVHARGQVAHFDLPGSFAATSLVRAINTYLPPDIRVLEAETAPPDFHARRDAAGKEYRFFIWNAPILLPTARNFHLHVPFPLNVDAMQEAAGLLTGKHDFAAFSANPSRIVETTVRTVYSITVSRNEEVVMIAASGEGFLYKMVRSIAGWLIRVGEGEMAAVKTSDILISRERTAAVPTAPSQGLFLWRVWYPESNSDRRA